MSRIGSVWLTCMFAALSLFTIAGTQISLGFLFLFWLFRSFGNKKPLWIQSQVDIAFFVVLMAVILSTVFSEQPMQSLINLKNLLLISTVYLISASLENEKHILITADIFIVTAALFSAIGFFSTDIMGGQRVMSFQSTTMTWGAMSAIFTLITLAMVLFGETGKKMWFYMALFTVQFIGMLFSYVRGAWVGFMAGLFVLALFKSKKMVLSILVFLFAVFLLAPDPVQDRITSIVDLNVGSTQVRFTQWKNAVKIFNDHPITGVGWIDLNEIHRRYAPPGADLSYQAYRIGHFHNNYIMFLVCFGVIGFLAFLFLMYRLFYMQVNSLKIFQYSDARFPAWIIGTLAATVAFWINGFFDWTFGDAEPMTLLWFTIGMVLAIRKTGIRV